MSSFDYYLILAHVFIVKCFAPKESVIIGAIYLVIAIIYGVLGK